MDFLTWITTNKEGLLIGLATVIAGARVIVKGLEIIANLTSWRWDNKLVACLLKIINILSIPTTQKKETTK